MGTSKTYDPRFHVPGSMQIVGSTMSGKTSNWLSKLIKDGVLYFRDDIGDSVCFHSLHVAVPSPKEKQEGGNVYEKLARIVLCDAK